MRNGTFRSVALVALVPLVMAVAGVLVLQSQLRARLVEATQTRLLAEAQGFAALYDQRRIVALREAIAYRSTRGDPAGSVYVLTDRAGAVLAGNLDGWPDGIAVQDTPQQVQIDGRPFLARGRGAAGTAAYGADERGAGAGRRGRGPWPADAARGRVGARRTGRPYRRHAGPHRASVRRASTAGQRGGP